MVYSNHYARTSVMLGEIKASYSAIFRFAPSLIYSGLVIVSQALAWFQAWFINRNLSGDILVLHYNVDFGIDLVGNPRQIYLFPLLGLGIFLLNLIILAFFYKDKNFKILTHLLLGAAILFSLFLNIALLSVYLINFR
jgi:hypothetical protein